jgi:glycosyltransferase involved in cell wall biosynthesis
MKSPRICLNMIVRDEQANIAPCLNSIAPFLDAFAIIDTGSTDQTVGTILDYTSTAGIPGEVISRPWVDFAHNRNEALAHCESVIKKLDSNEEHDWYLVFMDADDRASGCRNNDRFEIDKHSLTKDRYDVEMEQGGFFYRHTWMIRLDPQKKWKWFFPVHEYLIPDGDWSPTNDFLSGGIIHRNTAGYRARNKRVFLEDAFTLLMWLKEHPNDPRAMYYLGQSFHDAEFPELAKVCYEKRLSLGGWSQEIYESLLYLGRTRYLQGDLSIETTDLFLRAFEICPQRLDAPYYLMLIWRNQKRFNIAWNFAKPLIDIPTPGSTLFMNRKIHEYAFLEEAALSAYSAKDVESFRIIIERILKVPNLPDSVRERCVSNLRSCSQIPT